MRLKNTVETVRHFQKGQTVALIKQALSKLQFPIASLSDSNNLKEESPKIFIILSAQHGAHSQKILHTKKTNSCSSVLTFLSQVWTVMMFNFA